MCLLIIGPFTHTTVEQLCIINFNVNGTFLGCLTSLGIMQGWHWLTSLWLSSSPIVRRLLVPFEVHNPQGIPSVANKQGLSVLLMCHLGWLIFIASLRGFKVIRETLLSLASQHTFQPRWMTGLQFSAVWVMLLESLCHLGCFLPFLECSIPFSPWLVGSYLLANQCPLRPAGCQPLYLWWAWPHASSAGFLSRMRSRMCPHTVSVCPGSR